MKQMFMNLLKEESGQGMAEYGLILALVAVVCVGALTVLGKGLDTKFRSVDSSLTPAP